MHMSVINVIVSLHTEYLIHIWMQEKRKHFRCPYLATHSSLRFPNEKLDFLFCRQMSYSIQMKFVKVE